MFQNPRKRSSPDDSRLNSPHSCGVTTLPDRAVMLDERVIMNLRNAEVRPPPVFNSKDQFQLNRQPSSMYFLSVQTETEPFHREQVVDWLSDVCRVGLPLLLPD